MRTIVSVKCQMKCGDALGWEIGLEIDKCITQSTTADIHMTQSYTYMHILDVYYLHDLMDTCIHITSDSISAPLLHMCAQLIGLSLDRKYDLLVTVLLDCDHLLYCS